MNESNFVEHKWKITEIEKTNCEIFYVVTVMVAIKQSTKDMADQLSSYKPLTRNLIWNFI